MKGLEDIVGPQTKNSEVPSGSQTKNSEVLSGTTQESTKSQCKSEPDVQEGPVPGTSGKGRRGHHACTPNTGPVETLRLSVSVTSPL